jgi:hypothetical protein
MMRNNNTTAAPIKYPRMKTHRIKPARHPTTHIHPNLTPTENITKMTFNLIDF